MCWLDVAGSKLSFADSRVNSTQGLFPFMVPLIVDGGANVFVILYTIPYVIAPACRAKKMCSYNL
jgi:hypothetical protein